MYRKLNVSKKNPKNKTPSELFSSHFHVLFVQEQELYQKEGLGVNEVHYVDNQDCIGR